MCTEREELGRAGANVVVPPAALSSQTFTPSTLGVCERFDLALEKLKGQEVPVGTGNSVGHKISEPIEGKVCRALRRAFPGQMMYEAEYLNMLRDDGKQLQPKVLADLLKVRADLQSYPTRFKYRQTQTTDLIFLEGNTIYLIDVKSHQHGKNSQPPNIITSNKVEGLCKSILDGSNRPSKIEMLYVFADWTKSRNKSAKISDVQTLNLLNVDPGSSSFYINLTAGKQVQFHHSKVSAFDGSVLMWCRAYLELLYSSKKRRMLRDQGEIDALTAYLERLA